MKEISILELNNLFVDTLQRCTYDLIKKNDETIEYEILEEFDIGVISFLHENSLNRLLENNFINDDIKQLSLKLRAMFLSMNEEKRNASCIRKDNEWHEILKLSDLIKEKKNRFDFKNLKIVKRNNCN